MTFRRTSPLAVVGSSVLDADGLNAFTFDATTSEAHILDGEVTTYPLVGGASVTDHAQLESLELELTGVVTNTPTAAQFLAAENALLEAGFTDVETRVQSTWGILLELRAALERVTVVTGLRAYQNMFLHSISLRRSGNPGFQRIVPVLRFKEVEFARLAAVDVPADVLAATVRSSGATEEDKGTQGAAAADQKERDAGNQTLALELVEAGGAAYAGSAAEQLIQQLVGGG